jgi:hypothetical protein
MPEFVSSLIDASRYPTMSAMVRGYLETCEFTDGHDDPEWEAAERFSEEAIAYATVLCQKFELENSELIEAAEGAGHNKWQIGSDLWYTRNGHGVGFWDRDNLKVPYRSSTIGEALSDAASRYNSSDSYAGDDKKIHFHDEHQISKMRQAVKDILENNSAPTGPNN